MKLLHRHDEKIQEIEKLTAELEKSPAFQKFRDEAAAETLQKREEAAAKIKALMEEQAEVIPKLQKDLVEKEEKYKKAEAALETASDEAKKAKITALNKSHSFEEGINKQREILIKTAFPEIDEAITFFQEKLSFLRNPGRIRRIAGGAKQNIFTMKKTVTEESNRDSVLSALAYCQSAIKVLESMKLSPILDKKMIEKMKAAIPAIDVYSEVTGTKPLPGSRG